MGNRIREAREEKRMTQEELSAKSGVNRGTIVALETGKEKDVLMSTVLKIAQALEKTVDELFFPQSA